MFFKGILLVIVVSTVAARESNLTLLEGKVKYAKEAKTPANFIKLICIVIFDPFGFERATATFVTGKNLLTTAEFLFDDDYRNRRVYSDGEEYSLNLSIRTSFRSNLLKVRGVVYQGEKDKDDYSKDPAILQVDDQSEYLTEGFPTIPKSPPVVDSERNIFGLKITDGFHHFLVLTFPSIIKKKVDCSVFKFKIPEDPKSLCAQSTASIVLDTNEMFDRGMPILTSSTIDGMFRKSVPTWHKRCLFVSTAKYHDWITYILNGLAGKNIGKKEVKNRNKDEATKNKDNRPADDETTNVQN